ncbi:OmpP1/FadL family transporter [Ancylomarina sp. YFZ004]
MRSKLLVSASLILAGLMTSQTASATDGYFSLAYGTQNKGMAGAGIAWYKNSLINGNPASLVKLGNQYQFGVNMFNPNREYTVTGNPSGMPNTFGLAPGTVESDSKVFFMPTFGANWLLNEKSSFSVALYGNGGMNTDYAPQVNPMDGNKYGTFGMPNASTGVDLGQMFLNLSYAYQVSEKHSFGVTAIAAYQYFEAKGIASLGMMSSDPTKLSDNGHDSAFGMGFKLGYLGQLTEKLSVGASYQTMVYMSEFEDYSGLFAEQGDFDIPSTWTVGLAYQANENWVFAADFKRIDYTNIASVSNKMHTPMDPAFSPLGTDKGSGFGWEDINVYKVGAEYSGIDTWTLRAGYSHCDQPIQKSEVMFNILAPGVMQDHITLGCSKVLNEKGNALHFAFVYAPENSVKGANPMDFDAAQAMQGNMVPNQTIEIKMSQIELEIAYSF